MKTLLRRPAVEALTGLRRTALADAIGRGEFPAPIKLTDGGRATAWIQSEIEAWLDQRVAKRDAGREAG